MLIDIFSYNGESILDLRLRYLAPYVDAFVIVEAAFTHSGEAKGQLFVESEAFRQVADCEDVRDKIHVLIVGEFPPRPEGWEAEAYMTEGSHESWWREQYQRDFAADYCLRTFGSGSDTIFSVCDIDEIPHAELMEDIQAVGAKEALLNKPTYLEMKMFYYNFNWMKKYLWSHAFVINAEGLAELRRNGVGFSAIRTRLPRGQVIKDAGWHCSYFLSRDDIRRKLEAFAHRECDREVFKTDDHLDKCLTQGLDLMGRGKEEDCAWAAAGEGEDLATCGIGKRFHEMLLKAQHLVEIE